MPDTFHIDEASSDDEYLWVDVTGMGTVCIKADDDGISVSIYPMHAVDEEVASCWATQAELAPDEEHEED